MSVRLIAPSDHPGIFKKPGVAIHRGDALNCYDKWPAPTAIVSDGAYGVSGFETDTSTADGLVDWYEPHVAAWSRHATPQTTLWFWNTELGWATVHPLLLKHGWEYRGCNVWNKGKGHLAGNVNTKTMRKFPVVSEVCVQYVRKVTIPVEGDEMSLQQWLRHEWKRTGLPFSKANEACGVKNAATRKYLTLEPDLWYFPPAPVFEAMVRYANEHGKPEGAPYFSWDGKNPLTGEAWDDIHAEICRVKDSYRAKFHLPFGVSNVWDEPPVRGNERIKVNGKIVHPNQKPLRLMELIIKASSDPGDVIWEPFGGLCTAALAAQNLQRIAYAAEVKPEFFRLAVERLVA